MALSPLRNLILGALAMSGCLACHRAPVSDFAFLKGFRHTGGPEPDGSITYRIFGDPAIVLGAIPSASTAPPERSAQGTLYAFSLPSGRRATLVVSLKPGKPCLLVVDP